MREWGPASLSVPQELPAVEQAPNERRRCLKESNRTPVNGSKAAMSEMAETLTTNMDMMAQKQSNHFI